MRQINNGLRQFQHSDALAAPNHIKSAMSFYKCPITYTKITKHYTIAREAQILLQT